MNIYSVNVIWLDIIEPCEIINKVFLTLAEAKEYLLHMEKNWLNTIKQDNNLNNKELEKWKDNNVISNIDNNNYVYKYYEYSNSYDEREIKIFELNEFIFEK